MAIYISINNMDVDFDAIMESEKYLTIIFLLFLIISNGFLICLALIRKQSAVLKEPRFAIRLSLSIGGIILALYTELVFAILIWEQHSNPMNCQTLYIARAFDQEFVPMLYGIGLIILAVDIMRRSSNPTPPGTKANPRPMCVLICAALPWIISLAIVTPLVLINVDLYDRQCVVEQSKRHQQVRIFGSTILQAGLAMIFGISTFICSSSNKRGNNKGNIDAFDDINTIPTSDVKHISSIDKTNQLDLSMVKNPYVTGYDDSQSDSNGYSFQNNMYSLTGSDNSSQNGSDNLMKEKIVLVLSCVVYMVTVVPFNALSLYIMETYDTVGGSMKFIYEPDTSLYIAYESVMWLRLTFPIILPLLWMTLLF